MWLVYGAHSAARNQHERDVLRFDWISWCGRGLSSVVRQTLEISVREMRNADARGGLVLGGSGIAGMSGGKSGPKSRGWLAIVRIILLIVDRKTRSCESRCSSGRPRRAVCASLTGSFAPLVVGLATA